MKTKITFISVVTLSIALLLTSCSGKGTVSTTEPQNTTAEDSTASADNSNTKLDDLYQQENRIFAEHKDIWDKLFGLMNKNTADSNGNYADHLADTAESNKDSFTDDEFKTLTNDIETIRKIEEQIAEIEKETTESDNNGQNTSMEMNRLSKKLPLFLKARVLNTAIFLLIHLQMQVNMPPISWHFLPQYSSTEMVTSWVIRCSAESIIRITMIL